MNANAKNRPWFLQPLAGVLLVVGASFAGAAVHKFVVLACLAGGLVLLAWRHRRSPHHVLGLLFAGFCLAPLLRRVHDHLHAWTPSNPILIAPYALLPVILYLVMRRIELFRWSPLAAVVPTLLAIAWGLGWGAIQNGISVAMIALLEWGSGPLLFCYVVQYREHFDTDKFRGWILWLTVFEAVYGLVQFAQPSPWDASWLMNSQMYTSMGFPTPFQMRTFGTLNSAGPFAAFLTYYLLIGTGTRSFSFVAPLALAALGTTMVRASWVVVAIGWILSVLLAPRKIRGKILGPMFVSVLLLGLAAQPFLDRIQPLVVRLQTFGNMKSDNSFQERAVLLEAAKGVIFATPLGAGLGSEGRAARYSNVGIAGIDNGFIALVWVLGWCGAAAYFAGWLAVFLGALPRFQTMPTSIYAAGITAMALFVFNAFGTAFSGLIAMMMWSSLGLFAGWALPPRFFARARGERPPSERWFDQPAFPKTST